MNNASNKLLRVIFSWPCIAWVLVIVHALINTLFYLRWVSVCAAQAADPNGGQWNPITFDPATFYLIMLPSLLLITARALDFTTKPFQMVWLMFTLALIFLSILLGASYSGDPQHGDDALAYGFLPLILLSTILFFGFALGNFFMAYAQTGRKILFLQLLFSMVTKIVIVLPIFVSVILYFSVSFTFAYMAVIVAFSLLMYACIKIRENRQPEQPNI